jgi:hypothetical protein
MNPVIQSVTDKLTVVFSAVDEILNTWEGEGNLQFPTLIGMMAIKMNWNEKQARENDPVIRYYVRNNPDWYVTRGARGGIMRSSDRQKKDQVKAAKDALKQQMKATIEAKVAAKSNTVTAESKPADSNMEDDDPDLDDLGDVGDDE